MMINTSSFLCYMLALWTVELNSSESWRICVTWIQSVDNPMQESSYIEKRRGKWGDEVYLVWNIFAKVGKSFSWKHPASHVFPLKTVCSDYKCLHSKKTHDRWLCFLSFFLNESKLIHGGNPFTLFSSHRIP